MDQNFQTSFIPKKPMIEERTAAPRSVNLLLIISIFIFFSVAIASAGLYFYQGIMQKNIADMKHNLELAKNRFELSEITRLQVLGKRLHASSNILSDHIAVSPIFNALSNITLKTVRYTKFSYSFADDKDKKVFVKMSGQAVGYKSIALQGDLFTANKYFIDPVFSNLALDTKTGNVTFDLEFLVDPSFVDYKQMLTTDSVNKTI